MNIEGLNKMKTMQTECDVVLRLNNTEILLLKKIVMLQALKGRGRGIMALNDKVREISEIPE